MPSSGDPVAPTRIKQLKVLMPPSLHKLSISDELASCFHAASGGGGEGEAYEATALVVSPFGKVWRVEVGRDDDGAFLGRGWAEFLDAHGIGVGWFVVLRHEGGGALTVKAFDTSFCIKEFGTPAAVSSVMESRGSKEVSCKPQFIRLIHRDSMEKMIIPTKFLKHYVEEYLNTHIAVLFSPLGKFCRIELERNQSGIFLAGGWPQFLAFHGISDGDVLLFRYEGNMVFQFKAFGLNGGQKDLKKQNTGIQQKTDTVKQSESPPIRKRKSSVERSSSEENIRLNTCMKSLNKTSAQKEPDHKIGPPSWIRKEITTYMLENILSLSVKFCNSIGFQKSCIITLKTTMYSTRSWQVRGLAYSKICYLLGEGWKRFCQDNKLKKGDLCTFNVIGPTLWHVDITHHTQEQKESPCSSSSRKRDGKNRGSICDGDNRPKYSIKVLSKALSYTKSVYEIGPPSWIQKQITPNSLKKYLSLAHSFCYQIGLRESCTITLKTSINDTRSWLVCGLMAKNSSYHLGSGWRKFYEDNNLKVGDVCTFNIVETLVWRVDITRQ